MQLFPDSHTFTKYNFKFTKNEANNMSKSLRTPDVCTVNELTSLSQRFAVARMLTQKKTYLEIAQETGASTATISRVNRALTYGSDGYSMVLERIGKKAE